MGNCQSSERFGARALNEQIVKNSANSSQDNDVAAIKDLKKIKTEVTQKGAELVRTKF